MRRKFLIRRLKCSSCGRLHRELPDCLVPYKHYASEVISGVLDGIVSPDDEDSADFPCETTMRRWHCWLEANRLKIDGYLKSTGYRLLGFPMELLGSRVPLLDKLRSSWPEWLETLFRFCTDFVLLSLLPYGTLSVKEVIPMKPFGLCSHCQTKRDPESFRPYSI